MTCIDKAGDFSYNLKEYTDIFGNSSLSGKCIHFSHNDNRKLFSKLDYGLSFMLLEIS